LDEREIAVCNRVREIRLKLKWGQPDFAAAIGISRVRLGSYEYAKAPIRYWLGRTICDRFNVSQRWLATGALPEQGYAEFDPKIEEQIGKRELFSKAYDERLSKLVEAHWVNVAKFAGVTEEELTKTRFGPFAFPPLGADHIKVLAFWLDYTAKTCLDLLPAVELQNAFYSQTLKAMQEFEKKHRAQAEKLRKKFQHRPITD